MEIKKYIAENEPKMLEDLFSLIRIPSISAKPEPTRQAEISYAVFCLKKKKVIGSDGAVGIGVPRTSSFIRRYGTYYMMRLKIDTSIQNIYRYGSVS